MSKKDNKKTRKINNPIIILLILIIIVICSVLSFKTDKKITEKKEAKNAISIDIYKYSYVDMDGDDYYGDDSEENNNEYVKQEKVGSITCKTTNCFIEDANREYALVKENDSYTLINYTNNKIIVEGFAKNKNSEDIVALLTDLDNNVHGITLQKKDKAIIYSLKENKTIEVDGSLFSLQEINSKYLFYKDLYATVMSGENKITFNLYDINTGNKIIEKDSYPIGLLGNKDEVYVEFYDDINNKSLIYNSKGNLILNDDNIISSTYLQDSNLIIIYDTKYVVYDTISFDKKYESKSFLDIYYIGDNYMLVVDNNDLNVLDLSGNILTTFIDNYYNDKYKIRNMYMDNNTINILVESDDVTEYEILSEYKDITSEDLDAYYLGYRYYYNIITKEKGYVVAYM